MEPVIFENLKSRINNELMQLNALFKMYGLFPMNHSSIDRYINLSENFLI